MDLLPIFAMLFVLILVGMIVGSILVFPIMRRLGALLEQRLQNRLPDDVLVRELRNLASTIHSLQHQVGQLSERQAHIEALLPDRDALRLPVGTGKE
jgi:hypothetical protein